MASSKNNNEKAKDDLFTSSSTGLTEDSSNAVFLDVLANDGGGAAKKPLSVDATSVNGARISIAADGRVIYDISTISASFKAQLQALNTGQFLTDTFTYTVKLGNGSISTATVTVQIAGVNDAAVITGTSTATVVETNAIQSTGAQLLATDVDNAATFVAQTNVNGSNGYGKFSINTAGNWTYTMNTAHNEFVGGTNYTDSITVATVDGTTRILTVTIQGTNDAAVITGTNTAVLTETNAAQSTGGQLSATDVDSSAAFVAQTNVAGNNGYGTFSINTAGTWTYTMNGAHNEFAAGTDYTDSINVTTADGTVRVLTVTIHGTNDAAVITGTNTAVLTETNAAQSTGGQLSATDVDSSAAFVAQTNVAGNNGYGTFSINTAGNWTYTMNTAHNEFVGGTNYTDSITVATVDGTSRTLTVTIQGTNDAAVITGTNTAVLSETDAAQSTGGQLSATDVDSSAAFVAQTNVAGNNGYGTFSINTAGTWTYTMNGAHNEFAAGTDYTDSINVTTADGTVGVLTVTIHGTNDAAVLSSDTKNLTEGDTAAAISTSGTLTITDVDSPATFVAQAGTVGDYGTFTINAAGAWTYTASSAHNEFLSGHTYTDIFSVVSADGTTTSVTVNIAGSNDATIVSSTVNTVQEHGLVATGNDPLVGSQTASGSFHISANDGIDHITIGGVSFNFAQIQAFSGLPSQHVSTGQGSLILNSYVADSPDTPYSGTIHYTYTLSQAIDNDAPGVATLPDTVDGTQFNDSIAIALTSANGTTTNGSLLVHILDDAPHTEDALTITTAEDAPMISGNVMSNDMLGADGATLTHVNVDSNVGFVALTTGSLRPDGFYSFTTAYGEYGFKSDGSWTFTSAKNIYQPAPPNASGADFGYVITDADGDTDTGAQSILVMDGAPAASPNPISLQADEAALSGPYATGSDFNSDAEVSFAYLSFTAGSDNLVHFAFSTDLESLLHGNEHIFWMRTSETQIVGTTESGTTPVILTLEPPEGGIIPAGETGLVKVTMTLMDNLVHSSGAGTQAIDLGNVSVIATDYDGDKTAGLVHVAVKDDVPVLTPDTGHTGGEVISGNVLANDVPGADGFAAGGGVVQISTAQETKAPGTSISGLYGSLLLHADGSYDYTPSANVTADDIFTYTVRDSDGDEVSSLLTIHLQHTASTITVNLSATPLTEGMSGLSYVFTATLSQTSSGDTKVVLYQQDGLSPLTGDEASSTITISAGSLSGALDIPILTDTGEDPYVDATSLVATMKAEGVSNTANDTLIIGVSTAEALLNDTIDDTTLTLTGSVMTEGMSGLAYIFTATLTHPSQGQTIIETDQGIITIEDGQTSNTLAIEIPTPPGNPDDVYKDGTSLTATIQNISGGNFEHLIVSNTAATAYINDTLDTTYVTLDDADVDSNGMATITAHVSNNVTETPFVITLSNGETITIGVGQNTGTSDTFAAQVGVMIVSVSNTTPPSGGNFEQLDTTDTAQVVFDNTGGGASVMTSESRGADNVVYEDNTNPASDRTGSFQISASDGIQSLDITDIPTPVSFSFAQIQAFGTTHGLVNTGEGRLIFDNYVGNATQGTVHYTYVASPVQNDGTQVITGNDAIDADAFYDSITLTVHGLNTSGSDELLIQVIDDVPTARVDIESVIPGEIIERSVTTNDSGGADGFVAANQKVVSVAQGSDPNDKPVEGGVDEDIVTDYGTLRLQADGSYTYTPHDGVTDGIDTFIYSIQDKDGDISATKLTIIISQNDVSFIEAPSAKGVNVFVSEDGIPSASDDSETRNASFTIFSSDGLHELNIGGTTFTYANHSFGFDGTQTVNTGEGTITLQSYVGDDFRGTVYYSYTANAVIDNDSINPTSPDTVNPFGFSDHIAVTLNGAGGSTTSTDLVARIVDSEPQVVNDGTFTVDLNTTTTGNVLENDIFSVDVVPNAPNPNTFAWIYDDATNEALSILNTYGTFIFDPNGAGEWTWQYTAGNTRPVSAQDVHLNYSLTDADGSQSFGGLFFHIDGNAASEITVPSVKGSPIITVYEEGLTPAGSGLETVSRSFTISSSDGIASLSIAGHSFTDLSQLAGEIIYTNKGALTIDSYDGDASGGTVYYSYTLSDTIDNDSVAVIFPDTMEGDNFYEHIALSLQGQGGSSAINEIVVRIVDDEPFTTPDTAELSPDGVTAVINSDVLANDHMSADAPTVFLGWDPDTTLLENYGDLSLDPTSGHWSYALDPNYTFDPNFFYSGELTYSLQDADGSTTQGSLTIEIHGSGGGGDTATLVTRVSGMDPDHTVQERGLATGDNSQTISEDMLNPNTFSISASDGIDHLLIGTESISLLELYDLSNNPKMVNTGQGMLLLDGYTGDNFSGQVHYSYTLSEAIPNDSLVFGSGSDSVDAAGFNDSIELSVYGANNSSASDFLVIRAIDDVPEARADEVPMEIAAGTALYVTGNGVLGNDISADGFNGGGVVGVNAGENLVNYNVSGNTTAAGQYGALTLSANGQYSYEAFAGTVPSGAKDTFSYTIRDSDGDLSIGLLIIHLNNTGDSHYQTGIVEEAALDTVTSGSDLTHGSVIGSDPTRTTETATGTLSIVGAISYAASTQLGVYGIFSIDTNGNYTYTLTSPVAGTATDTVSGAESFSFNAYFDAAQHFQTSGTVTIDIVDDVPRAPTVTLQNAVIVDETPGVQGAPATDVSNASVAALFDTVANKGVDSDVPSNALNNGALSFASTGANAIVSLGTLNYGADGPAASNPVHYAFTLNNTASGLTLTDGRAITLSLDGEGRVLGTVDNGNTTAFALALNSNTGQVYLAQYLSLHQDGGNPAILDPNTVGIMVSLTDSEGDKTDSSITDISSAIRFLDDAPVAVDDYAGTNILSGNVMLNDVSGADGAGLTQVDIGTGFIDITAGELDANNFYTFLEPNGLGIYGFKADGSWMFEAASPQGAFNLAFVYQITDGDGSTSRATQSLSVLGAPPDQVSLEVTEAALPDGSQVYTDPSVHTTTASATLSFTAGMQGIVGFFFSQDLSTLATHLNGDATQDIFWVRHSDVEIIGYLDASHTLPAITLDLVPPNGIAPGESDVATVSIQLADNLPHPAGDGAQLLDIGSIEVQAKNGDGGVTERGIANFSVQDDVPVGFSSPVTYTRVEGDNIPIAGHFNNTSGADGANLTDVSFNGGDTFIALNTLPETNVLGLGLYHTFTNANGTIYGFRENGDWVFVAGKNINNTDGDAPSSVMGKFTDGDGDTSFVTQNFQITDGAGPLTDAPVTANLEVNEADIFTNGVNFLYFTAGSDDITKFAFDTNLSTLTQDFNQDGTPDLFWKRTSDIMIKGFLDAGYTQQAAYVVLYSTPNIPAGQSDHISIAFGLDTNLLHASGLDAQTMQIGTVKVFATDSDGSSTFGTLSLSVQDGVPIANADTSPDVIEGGGIIVPAITGVLSNDTSPDGLVGGVIGVRAAGSAAMTAVTSGTPTVINTDYGKLTISADGSYTYQSTLNSITSDTTDHFVYSVRDADGDTATGNLYIPIQNIDPIVFSITPVSGQGDVREGETASYTISYTGSLAQDRIVDVLVQVTDQSAAAGSDYTDTSDVLRFVGGSGITSQTFTVPILQDGIPDSGETFRVGLVNLSPYSTLDPVQNNVIQAILDSDSVVFSIAPDRSQGNGDIAIEGQPLSYIVSYTGTIPDGGFASVNVNIGPSGDPAASPEDYDATGFPMTLTFYANASHEQTVTLPTINDTVRESPEELLSVYLENPVNATIDFNNIGATGFIEDNEPIQFYISGEQYAYEGDTYYLYTVGYTGHLNSGETASVQVIPQNGSAIAPDDYQVPTPGSPDVSPNLVFTFSGDSSATSHTEAILIMDDELTEGEEQFTLSLTNPTGPNYTPDIDPSASSLSVTIVDNDGGAGFSTMSSMSMDGGDTLNLISGTAGNDTLAGTTGADRIEGNAGDDVIIYSNDNTDASNPLAFVNNDSIDGGDGMDTLRIDATGSIDLSGKDISNIEQIVLTDESAPHTQENTSITLTANDVLNYTDNNNTLTVLGTQGDSVQLPAADAAANWVGGDAHGVQPTSTFTNAAGQAFNVYTTHAGAALQVAAEVTVTVA